MISWLYAKKALSRFRIFVLSCWIGKKIITKTRKNEITKNTMSQSKIIRDAEHMQIRQLGAEEANAGRAVGNPQQVAMCANIDPAFTCGTRCQIAVVAGNRRPTPQSRQRV